MQRNGNSVSACASCKHQRKKCTNKCILAPFFPVEKSREFQAVHKVFGVSNITKIITSLNEENRKVAVDSLVWEALCRHKDPVLGPYGEYQRICEELRRYKAQYHQVPNSERLIGWNNSKVININNGGVSNDFQRNASSPLILPQHHLPNAFNQHYFLAGEYNRIDSKSMESTLWEGSS